MNKKTDLLRKKLNDRLNEAAGNTMYGTVKSVDEAKRVCTVQIGGIDYESVLLYAVENADLTGYVYIPTVGSTILVSRIAGSDRMFVQLFSKIEKIIFTHENKTGMAITGDAIEFSADKSLLKITQSGFTLKRNSSGLKKTLIDLLTAMQQLTVTTGVGPSGIPVNAAEFSQIQQDLSNYMEE
jgi:hypothetical protein